MVAGWWNDYNFSCQPVDYSDTPKANRVSNEVIEKQTKNPHVAQENWSWL